MIRFRLKGMAPAALVLAAVSIVLFGSAASAATTSNVGGDALRISPVRTDLTIQPGTTQTVDVYVQNVTSQTVTLEGVVDDFTASNNESGEPDILLNGQEAPSHSLKQFVAPIGTFTLASQEQKDVKVSITIPKGAAGGGYYGAVRFEPASAATGKTVNLTASVGSLILVKVPGNIVEKMSLPSFDVRPYDPKTQTDGSPSTIFTTGKNLDAVVRFQNQGNVQEQPFGKVVLKKGSKQIALYEINNSNPRGNVLPDSIRRFTVHLTGIGSIGKYTIEGNFGYGSNGQLLTGSKTFYIVPVADIVIGVVIIALIAFAIFGLPKLIRSYNRSVVQKATRSKKRR